AGVGRVCLVCFWGAARPCGGCSGGSRGLVPRPVGWEHLAPGDVLRLVGDDPPPGALLGAWAGGSSIIASGPAATTSGFPPPERAGGWWIGYLGFGAAGRDQPAPPAPGGSRALPDAWGGRYGHVLRPDRAPGCWYVEAP